MSDYKTRPSGQLDLVDSSKARELAITAMTALGIAGEISLKSIVRATVRHHFGAEEVEQILAIQRDFRTRPHQVMKMYEAGLSLDYIGFLAALRVNLEDYPEVGNFRNSIASLHRFVSLFGLSDYEPEDAASEIATAHRSIKRKLPWLKGLRESIKILQLAADGSGCELASAVQVIVGSEDTSGARDR